MKPLIKTPMPRRQVRGFTLIELMITIIVIGILSAAAAPSFRSFIANQRIRAASMDLVSQLTFARSEAIKQNSNVTVASTSTNTAWQSGWTIIDSASPPETLKNQNRYSGLTITGSVASMVYDRSGRATTANQVTFQIADAVAGSTIQPRCVTVGVTGAPIAKLGTCP